MITITAVISRDVDLKITLGRRPYLLPSRQKYLNSLLSVNKDLDVPKVAIKIFHPRDVKFKGFHTKYMVTDNMGVVGTSNWSKDYFSTSAGVSIAFKTLSNGNESNLITELNRIYMRDWDSVHCKDYESRK